MLRAPQDVASNQRGAARAGGSFPGTGHVSGNVNIEPADLTMRWLQGPIRGERDGHKKLLLGGGERRPRRAPGEHVL